MILLSNGYILSDSLLRVMLISDGDCYLFINALHVF